MHRQIFFLYQWWNNCSDRIWAIWCTILARHHISVHWKHSNFRRPLSPPHTYLCVAARVLCMYESCGIQVSVLVTIKHFAVCSKQVRRGKQVSVYNQGNVSVPQCVTAFLSVTLMRSLGRLDTENRHLSLIFFGGERQTPKSQLSRQSDNSWHGKILGKWHWYGRAVSSVDPAQPLVGAFKGTCH